MITRYSSRLTPLTSFIRTKLENATHYDRIAGYFCSSILEIAGEELEKVQDHIRIICNSSVAIEDVQVARDARNILLKREWCSELEPETIRSPYLKKRLEKLYQLLINKKLEIRIIPDEIYGLLHGKAGIISYNNGNKTSFLGSINETGRAFKTNYELVWEDDSLEAISWLENEFNYFWNHPQAIALADFIVEDIKRLSEREDVSLDEWRENIKIGSNISESIPTATVEENIFRREFGLWEHQKYFVELAFKEHQKPHGARFVLADQVGLGKTIQLAMTAKLMACYGEKPILIIVPKTLLYQWKDELFNLLEMPSAIWTGKGWLDEAGYEYPALTNDAIKRCPRRIGIVSQGLITRGGDEDSIPEILKKLKFECVIIDEAHRAKRSNGDKETKAVPNNLLKFINAISNQTQSLLLATATPVQLHLIEAFDLLNALDNISINNKGYEFILGSQYSTWRQEPQTMLNMVCGKEDAPNIESTPTQAWDIMRDPFPESATCPVIVNQKIEIIRHRLEISADTFRLKPETFNDASRINQNKIKDLYQTDNFILNCNPYIRHIIRRTR